ncbi:permease prefix domain 1-containing protein [Gemmatimonadota bacterium]
MLEERIAEWRAYLSRRQAIHAVDVDELEDHLRNQVSDLQAAGLDEEEAFLIAVKRIGDLDSLSQEYAREYSERLWKRLVVPPGTGGGQWTREATVAVSLAVAAGVAIKIPELFGINWGEDADTPWYALNLSLFTLPFLAAFLAWKRALPTGGWIGLAGAFVAAALVMNLMPFVPEGYTMMLAVLHLPMALLLAVAVAYGGGEWRDPQQRMNYVRFSGEWFIYYVLIALGGGVLSATTMLVFEAAGMDAQPLVVEWIIPAKQSVIENMAPVLTLIFTPLFTLMLLAFLGTMAWTGSGINVEREVLIAFDLLLVLVVGLHLYAISARDPHAEPGLFDKLQFVLVVCALLVDAMALWAILARITEFGFSPNRVAALGENLILLANLGGAAVLYALFLSGRKGFASMERWQTSFLPVYLVWAVVVVVVFPIIFGFI